jgi:hypothetical protein
MRLNGGFEFWLLAFGVFCNTNSVSIKSFLSSLHPNQSILRMRESRNRCHCIDSRIRGTLQKKRKNMIFFRLIFTLLFFFSVTANASNCKALLKEHLQTDLALPYSEFDQTQGKGWRILTDQNCNLEAAKLIERYIEKNAASESSLVWHIAQARALAGKYKSAIKFARRSLASPEKAANSKLLWNDYVLGSIAFLEGNKIELIKRRDALEAGRNTHFGNEMNLKILNSFVHYFDKSYKYALENAQKL